MIGEMILHYKIIEKLGEGGMGVVYKAQDIKLNRTVALKFLTDKVNQDAEAKKRFLQEAQAVASLNHSNICTIHGIEESDGSLFMVMEYVDGGTLTSKIPFSKTNDALKTAVEIGEALQEAHSKGIVHRDIKADNIMLTSNGQARVMDFGLAKLKGALRLTKSLSTVGTLGYMAPEQIQGGEVDNRSDIFSFGVLLFEMLTGELPFRGEHEAAIIYSVVNEEPQDIVTMVPDLSLLVVNLIQKCLEKDPEDRYQAVKEAVSELKRAMKKSSGSMAKSTITRRVDVPRTSQIKSGEQQISVESKKSFLSRKYIIELAGILIILAAAIFLFNPWKSSVEINPDMKMKTLDLPFSEIGYPGLSGDGNWAAFPGKDAEGNWHVYFMNTGGGDPKAITNDSSLQINSVDVSFDGRLVVYDSFEQFGKKYTTSIYIISSLGGERRLLARNAMLPRWEPDGKRIFYVSSLPYFKNPNLGNIYRSITPGGTDDRLEFVDSISVLNHFSMSVSPDNKSIAYLRSFPGNYEEIMIRNLVTGDERQLTNNKKGIDEVCWASNNRIIFSSNISGNTNLWMIPAEGGKQTQITKGLGPDLGIKISTDLNKLLYYQTQRYTDFWIGDLKKGTSRQITFDDRFKFNPIISPDERQIAFFMFDMNTFSSNASIYVSNIDGSNRRQIVSSQNKYLILSNAAWSPDGSLLSYMEYNRSDTAQFFKSFVINPEQNESRFVGDGQAEFWLNSDSLLLFDKNNFQMHIASISKRTITDFWEDSTYAFPVPGNKFVVYTRDSYYNTKAVYYIVPVDRSFKRTGPDRKVELHKFKDKGYNNILTISRSRDYMVLINPEHKLLRFWFVSGKEELIPGTYPNLDPQLGTWSFSDSDLFSYSVIRSKGKLVMIENLF